MASGLLVPVGVSAQSLSRTAIDVQNFWPSAGPSHTLALRSTDVQPHLSLGFGLVANFAYRPLVFRSQTQPAMLYPAVDYALTTDFVWGMGLFDRLQFGIAVPLVVAQSGLGLSPITGGGADMHLSQTALRDIRFDAGVVLVRRARRTGAEGVGLRVDLGGAIPTGDDQGYQGAASATFAPMLVLDYRVSGFTFTGNIGARVRQVAAVANLGWGSQGLIGGGVSYRPTRFDRLVVAMDALGLVPLHGDIQVTSMSRANGVVPVEMFLGARYAIDRARDIEVALGAGAPLTNVATVPAFRVLAGIEYSPKGLDNDEDGVIESDDSCPAVTEDRDGFQDQDGCPDPDNDGDRIDDHEDRCPNVPEDVDNFQDRDGCPDPDNDGDGIADADDRCAVEPAGSRPDPARPGCPIPDRDGDGVLDGDDNCPDEPRGQWPDPARAGCPLPDRDRDGVGDAEDLCPDDPRGTYPDRFREGCPDPDRDHDGVANEVDRCVDQPETINGITDDDGCPDEGGERVRWAGQALVFDPVIRLAPRTRNLRRDQVALFAQAAQWIRARGAEVERVMVEVVPAGPAAMNEATRLAGLVADVLAARGIARERIEATAAHLETATPTEGRRPLRPVRASAGEVRIRVSTRTARR